MRYGLTLTYANAKAPALQIVCEAAVSAVGAEHMRVVRQTGCRTFIVVMLLLTCLAMLLMLSVNRSQQACALLAVAITALAGFSGIETGSRKTPKCAGQSVRQG